uniref:Transmembrane protein n=1 Tax=Angiostrongylus cantonensis TaxID=6313 RepID=A0A0K0D1F2_ANGCA
MSAIQGKRKSTGMSLFVDDSVKPPTKKTSGGLYDSGDEEDRSVPRVDDTTVDTSRDEDFSTVPNGIILKEPHVLKEENETARHIDFKIIIAIVLLCLMCTSTTDLPHMRDLEP